MADEDNYDGRKPSFGMGERGMFLRGFRSKRGAPLADPSLNRGAVGVGLKKDKMGFTSNWDSVFRNTASNNFGASGRNTAYLGSPTSPTGAAGPTGPAGTEADQADIYAPGVTGAPSAPPNFSGTAPSHAQVWSAPPPRRGDDSMPGAPYMPKGPNWKMQMPKMAGTYDALLQQNKALVAPGGMQGMLQPPKTYNQGWQKTSDDERRAIGRQFGWNSIFQ